ncbi:MAG TPA: sugar phosphate isomerase/epimerase [Epulopiscium sp.]|nr:sugar phosphate isomerase/epimerase [Candidatus Epulonipiscium sp.]
MKIGLRAHDYGRHKPEDLIRKIKEDGFEAIQLAMPKAIEGINSHDEVTQELVDAIHNECVKHNIEVTVLGCYVEPSLLDTDERNTHVQRFLRTMDFMKTLDATCIGTETTNFEYPESQREEVFNVLVDSVRKMVEKAEEIGVDVAIEPVSRHTLNTPELTARLLIEVPSERLKVIFDPVNLLTAQNITDQNNLWDRSFEAFGDKICAVHIKGAKLNDAGELISTSLKDSQVNYAKIINWLKQNKPNVTLLREEIKEEIAKDDLEFIKSFL